MSVALVRAAEHDVTVRVITDGIGTDSNLPMFTQWKKAGVEHRIYNPHLLFGPQGWSRTHRKLAVIDHVYAFCGGINIFDDFDQNGTHLDTPRWDFAMEAQGPVVADVRNAFDTQWQRIRLGVKPRKLHGPSSGENSQPKENRWRARRGDPRVASGAFGRDLRGRSALRHVRRPRQSAEPARDRESVSARNRPCGARSAAGQSHFMPGRKLCRALVRAAQRGVRMSLVIGRKEFVALDYATPFLYGNLLKHG